MRSPWTEFMSLGRRPVALMAWVYPAPILEYLGVSYSVRICANLLAPVWLTLVWGYGK